MFFLEDPITTDPTSRFLTEEDEELSSGFTDQYKTAPTCEFIESFPSQVSLVFLDGAAPSILYKSLFCKGKALGTIGVPKLQRLTPPNIEENSFLQTRHIAEVSMLSETLCVVSSSKQLPHEQAAIWTKYVMSVLKPTQVLTVSTMPAMEYRGPGSPADEDLIFSLQTSAMSSNKLTDKPPSMPEGMLLTGVPAALLAYCEQQELPSCAIVGVQIGPAPDAKFVGALATAAHRATRQIVEIDTSMMLSGSLLQTRISQATERVFSTSVSNSMYI